MRARVPDGVGRSARRVTAVLIAAAATSATLARCVALAAEPAAGQPGAAAASPVADTVPGVSAKIDTARWESGYGEKFFQVVGTISNASAKPLGAVRIRCELLDAKGAVVASFVGWNARAETLGDLDGEAATAELKTLAPAPIAPGASDRFRATFLADETPEFASQRVQVLKVLPPEEK